MNGLVLRRVFLASLRTRRLATLLSLLAIALGVVRAHGGRIDVSSKPGEGSEFVIFLPVGLPNPP